MDKIDIKLRPGQKIFLTSDTHFGHKNVITFCARPFADTKDMFLSIKKNWNGVVGENDIVFHLGDVCWFNSRRETRKFIEQLNGTIYIVPGNHDKLDQFDYCDPEKIKVLSDNVVVYVQNHHLIEADKSIEIFLSHCPMMTWPHRTYGVPNLFGHIHSGPNSKAEVDQNLPLWPYQYDVGVDNNNYAPIELKEALKKVNWSPKKESN